MDRFKTQLEESAHGDVTAELEFDLVRKYKLSFYYTILFANHSVSQKANLHLFGLVFTLVWRGLSLSCLDLLHRVGLFMSSRTFLKQRDLACEKQRAVIHQTVLDFYKQPSVCWIDNYSKIFRAPRIRLDSGSYRQCLWTAWAVSTLPETVADSVNLRVLQIKTRQGNLVPLASFPAYQDLFNNLSPVILCQALNKIAKKEFRFSTAYCTQEQVFNIPLKPKCCEAKTSPTLVSQSTYGLKHFVPVKISANNCGENKGLARVIQELERVFAGTDEFYFPIKCDVNIYWRYTKLLYSKQLSEAKTRRMRLQTCLMLGTWHPFKVACETVWKKHANTFLAPAFHALFPNALCFVKPKLVTILVMFTYLRRVYPLVRDLLKTAISRACEPRWKNNLLALQALFEYFIPVVRTFLVFL